MCKSLTVMPVGSGELFERRIKAWTRARSSENENGLVR